MVRGIGTSIRGRASSGWWLGRTVRTPKQEVFAEGWITGERDYFGRPDDILQAPDGSLLVSDDWAGAIYRISYAK